MNNIFIRSLQGRGAILNYHRILPLNKDFGDLVNITVSTDNFFRQLNFIKKNFDVISLDSLILHLNSQSNDFKIAITFDDGYRDNLYYAYPILEKLNIPATIYVITKFIDNKFIPWWIKLENFIKHSKNITNKKKEFNYFKNEILFNNQLAIDRQISFITKKIKSNFKRKKIFLNHKELKYLSEQKLITIGSHSHSHYNFSRLEGKEALNELKISKYILEKLTKKKIVHFSYPYGSYENINFNHTKILKKLGYLSAVTTIRKKIVQPNFFLLPRIFVNNDTNLLRLKLKLFGLNNFY